MKENYKERIDKAKELLANADYVLIVAGAGLSTAGGFEYSGEKFEKYFKDFGDKYGFKDMYSGGFYPYSTEEERWAYWSRYVYIICTIFTIIYNGEQAYIIGMRLFFKQAL